MSMKFEECAEKCYMKCVNSDRPEDYCKEQCSKFCRLHSEVENEAKVMGIALVVILFGLFIVIAGYTLKMNGLLSLGLLIEFIGILIKLAGRNY